MTDHQSLTWLQELKEPKGRLARWVLTLQEYEFIVKHRPGKLHSNADTLSRFPRTSIPLMHKWNFEETRKTGVAATEVHLSWSREEIIRAQHDDPSISLVVHTQSPTNMPPGDDDEQWKMNG